MSAKRLAALSIAANVLLLGTLAAWWRRPAPRVVVVETNAPPRIVERRVEVPVPAPAAFDWRKVESEDYRQYIANLRAIGCPESTVRDIIIADVNALFESRRRALVQPHMEFKPWKADEMPVFSSAPAVKLREQFEQLRLLAEEKRSVLRELLGVDLPERAELAFAPLNPREQLLTFLPEDKRLRVEEIERRFTAQLMQRMPDGSGAEQLGNYKRLQEEKRAELAALLTPQELEDYDLRFSTAAVNLRARYGRLELSEQEFRELVRLRKKFDDEFSGPLAPDPNDVTAAARRAAAEAQLEHHLTLLLGPRRLAEMQREEDQAYRGAAEAASGSGLPERVAASVFDMKRIALAEFERVQADVTLPPAERQAVLAEVRQAVEEAVGRVLGREAYAAYLRHPGSIWLHQLRRAGAADDVARSAAPLTPPAEPPPPSD